MRVPPVHRRSPDSRRFPMALSGRIQSKEWTSGYSLTMLGNDAPANLARGNPSSRTPHWLPSRRTRRRFWRGGNKSSGCHGRSPRGWSGNYLLGLGGIGFASGRRPTRPGYLLQALAAGEGNIARRESECGHDPRVLPGPRSASGSPRVAIFSGCSPVLAGNPKGCAGSLHFESFLLRRRRSRSRRLGQKALLVDHSHRSA
jgi:hypothetical protein